MSSISLFSNTAAATHEGVAKPLTAHHALQSAAGDRDASDTIRLSEQARARALYQQGQSVAAIAAQLSSTLDAVNDYLGLSAEKELEKAVESSNTASGSTAQEKVPAKSAHPAARNLAGASA